jgi:hypothetical protein
LRVKYADLLPEDDRKEVIVEMTESELAENLEQNVELRAKQNEERSTKGESSTRLSDDEEDDDDEGDSGATFQMQPDREPSTRQTMRQGGTLLFTRKHEDASQARL